MVRKYLTRSAVKAEMERAEVQSKRCQKAKGTMYKSKTSKNNKKPIKIKKVAKERNSKKGKVLRQRLRRDEASNEKSSFLNLGPDELEMICGYLDSQSALNMMISCKGIYYKLHDCSGFWHRLCHKENFNDYTALKNDSNEEGDEEESDIEEPKTKVAKRKSSERFPAKNSPKSSKAKRLCYSGELFHDVKIPRSAPFWRKVFLRGLAMRRNLCQGRFEMWRLFLTDEDSLPVKKMMHDTSFRELRSSHRNSKFNQRHRRVRIHRYWTEDYMVAIQHRPGSSFNEIFVWEWDECQNPKFLYSYDLYPDYPNGLHPTAFFLWKKYLVLLPVYFYVRSQYNLTSIIRVHDLSDNMKLVGSYNLPFDGQGKMIPVTLPPTETAHLHKLGNKAVALCRMPAFTMFVFNLPDCQLLANVKLSFPLQRPLEKDDLDQRFLMRSNSMYFMFHPTHFFEDYEEDDEDDEEAVNRARMPQYGRLLVVNFDKFLKSEGNRGSIEMFVDEKFDSPCDYIEKVSIIGEDRMACILVSGKLVLKDIERCSGATCSTITRLEIPCPEPLYANPDTDLNIHGDTDGPTMSISRDGDVILVMQHFEDGRKIYAYDVKYPPCRQLYTIDLDNQLLYHLNEDPGYVSIDMDGNFVCAADLEKIVVWNSKTGKYIRTIPIPKHYNVREDPNEVIDRYCWKGHTDFAFAEDGIVIVHSQRDFPVAADIILFW